MKKLQISYSSVFSNRSVLRYHFRQRHISHDIAAIDRIIRERFPVRKLTSILDIGCGTESYTLSLSQLGYHATGLDISPDMIRQAKQKAVRTRVSVSFIIGDVQTCTVKRQFHVAFSLFDILSYMTTSQDILTYFSKAASFIIKGGLFLFDCWYSPGVVLTQPENTRQVYTYGPLEVHRKKILP